MSVVPPVLTCLPACPFGLSMAGAFVGLFSGRELATCLWPPCTSLSTSPGCIPSNRLPFAGIWLTSIHQLFLWAIYLTWLCYTIPFSAVLLVQRWQYQMRHHQLCPTFQPLLFASVCQSLLATTQNWPNCSHHLMPQTTRRQCRLCCNVASCVLD